jgi:hypothetical protein
MPKPQISFFINERIYMNIFFWILSVLGSLVMCYSNFFRSNSEEIIGIKMHPFYWWLFAESCLTYIGMTNFDFVCEKLGGDKFKTAMIFMFTKVVVDIALYTMYYSFRPKHAVALFFICCSLVALKWPDPVEDQQRKEKAMMKKK